MSPAFPCSSTLKRVGRVRVMPVCRLNWLPIKHGLCKGYVICAGPFGMAADGLHHLATSANRAFVFSLPAAIFKGQGDVCRTGELNWLSWWWRCQEKLADRGPYQALKDWFFGDQDATEIKWLNTKWMSCNCLGVR